MVQLQEKLGMLDLTVLPLMPVLDASQLPTVRPWSSTEAGSWMRVLLKV